MIQLQRTPYRLLFYTVQFSGPSTVDNAAYNRIVMLSMMAGAGLCNYYGCFVNSGIVQTAVVVS